LVGCLVVEWDKTSAGGVNGGGEGRERGEREGWRDVKWLAIT
jgi:hypothetical protein